MPCRIMAHACRLASSEFSHRARRRGQSIAVVSRRVRDQQMGVERQSCEMQLHMQRNLRKKQYTMDRHAPHTWGCLDYCCWHAGVVCGRML